MKNLKLFEELNEAGTRVSLSDEDFKNLVNGRVVTIDNVQIALQDIGYDRMQEILDEARD